LLDKEAEVTVALVALVVLVVVIVVVVVLLAAVVVVVEAAEGVEDVVSELETETYIIIQRNYQDTVELRYNVMNGIFCVFITEEYNVKVNREELIGSTEYLTLYRGADKSLARPTSRCILFDGENISFDVSLVI
jgi:hypothetical protein